MLDLTNQLASAPGYALESSSDESDWDEMNPRTERTKPNKPRVESSAEFSYSEIIVLIGEAGEKVAMGAFLEPPKAVGITIDGKQVASIYLVKDSQALALVSPDLPVRLHYPLVLHLKSAFTGTPKATILSTYHLPTYISPPPTTSILALSSNALKMEGVAPFQPPNLLHGLPSAFMTLFSHEGTVQMFLVPTTTPTAPLNGPFSYASSQAYTSTEAWTDVKPIITRLATNFEWSWYNPDKKDGQGFAWLVKQRQKQQALDASSNMYM